MDQQRITKNFKPFIGCRNITCSGCIIFLIIILILILLGYIRLDIIFSEIVKNMNEYIDIPEYSLTDMSTVKQAINSQVTEVGINNIRISQQHLATIINENINTQNKIYVLVKENALDMFIPIELKNLEPALYMKVEIKQLDNVIKIDNVVIGNISLPEFLIDFLLENFMTVNGFDKNNDLKEFSIKTFLPKIKDAEVKEIKFAKEEVIVQIYFTPSII